MEIEKNIILSIETAVEGGSLALYRGESEIDSWTGTREISKAEDVLEQISELLKRNAIEKSRLRLVAVSSGAGSSTGTKIGLSTASGLGNALGIGVVEVSVLEALLIDSTETAGRADGVIITVIPVGKNLICRQIFDDFASVNSGQLRKPPNFSVVNIQEFNEQLKHTRYSRIIFHRKAFQTWESFSGSTVGNDKFRTATTNNLAALIGKTVIVRAASDNEIMEY